MNIHVITVAINHRCTYVNVYIMLYNDNVYTYIIHIHIIFDYVILCT